MLYLLLTQVLQQLGILQLGKLQAVGGFISEFLTQLKALDGFGFDFTVV